MSEEVKKYRVLKPVAISGIVQRGAIVELTASEAENIGIGEYLEEVVDEAASEKESSEKSGEETGTETQTEESGSAEAGKDSEEVA